MSTAAATTIPPAAPTPTPPAVLLAHHLKELRLPTCLREYERCAQQCAQEGVDHVRYLLRLVEMELIDRERRLIERRIKAARFPIPKSLDAFDFLAIPSVNKPLVLDLARGGYIAVSYTHLTLPTNREV